MNPLEATFKDLRRGFAVVWVFSIVASTLMLASPLYMSNVYDKVLSSRSLSTLTVLTIIALITLLALGAIDAVRRIILSRIGSSLDADISSYFLENSLMNEKANSEQAMEGMGQLHQLRNFITGPGAIALFDIPTAPIFLIIMFYLHPLLGLVTVVGASILAIIALYNQKSTDPSTQQASSHANKASHVAQILTRNNETVRSMGMMNNAIGLWGKPQALSLIAGQNAAGRSAWLSSYSKVVRMVLQIMTLCIAAILVIRGEISAGMIFISSIVSGRALAPIDAIIANWKSITTAKQSYYNIKKILDDLQPLRATMQYSRPTGHIEVEQLGYSIQGSPVPILQGFSFSMPSGRTIGMIGPSGAGKSTLARILAGAISPTRGVVKFDGIDISKWDKNQLGRFIGYVPQDIELFPGTVAENIARLDPNLSTEAVIEVARLTGIHDFIQSMPDGYNTIVGPGAYQPSGGQRQRIAIARAFYGNPPIIIMDEPNASLDNSGEAALVQAINTAHSWGATVIVVSHRPALLEAVDTILVLENGRIADYGPKEAVFGRAMGKNIPAKPMSPPIQTEHAEQPKQVNDPSNETSKRHSAEEIQDISQTVQKPKLSIQESGLNPPKELPQSRNEQFSSRATPFTKPPSRLADIAANSAMETPSRPPIERKEDLSSVAARKKEQIDEDLSRPLRAL